MFSLIKKRVTPGLIKYAMSDRKKIIIRDRAISFHDISKSHLLKQIAVEGYRSYEGELVKFIENYPWPIERFIDGGSYIGFYSILASIVFGKKVDVVAIEPFPDNIEYIKRIRETNNLDFELIEKALGSAGSREQTMYYPVGKRGSKLPSSGSLVNSFKGTDGIFKHLPFESVDITTVTLSILLDKDDRNTLIKLDCEGAELDILKNAPRVLERRNINFIIEIMINDKDKKDIYDLMAGYGYSAYLISNAGFIKEDRPLTLPYPNISNRTIWKNHFFTKNDEAAVRKASLELYGYYI